MDLRLGKKEHEADPRTMMLGNFMTPKVVPNRYDFDRNRARFPINAWGNDAWGNCVKVGQANQLIRLERLEQKRTLKFDTKLVVDGYKEEVERQFGIRPMFAHGPGDEGLSRSAQPPQLAEDRLDSRFHGERNDTRTYTISAFGEILPGDYDQVKAAIYLLHGVQLGFWLPKSVVNNFTLWDYQGENGPDWIPGSWGGHLVYAKAYDGDEVEILTWGLQVKATKSFVAKYCDEAWAVVDKFNNWRKKPEIDAEGMVNYLREIGATGIESGV